MAYQNINSVAQVTNLTKSNSVYVEVGGSLRRIRLDDFVGSINAGDELLLQQVAWGVAVNNTTSAMSIIGNTTMFNEYVAQVGRYLVTPNGRAAKLLSTNSSKFADGGDIDETIGNVMVIAPKLYYLGKTDSTNGITYMWFSSQNIGGKKLANCNNGEHICLGAYLGAVVNETLVSRAGHTPTVQKSLDAFWNAARRNGGQWGLMDYDCWRWTAFMALSKYGSPDVQTKLGYGICGSGFRTGASANSIPVGRTKMWGDATSSSVMADGDTNSSLVSLFGVENLWGQMWQFIQGIYFGSSDNGSSQSQTDVYIYNGNRIPSAAERTSRPSGEYRQVSRIIPTSDNKSGFIGSMLLGVNLDLIVSGEATGTDKGWNDAFWAQSVGQVLSIGGAIHNGQSCGIFATNMNSSFNASGTDMGARLAYYGQLKFVNGKDINEAV